VILIEIFHSDEPEKLVAHEWAAQRAAELFTGEARCRQAPVEGCRQSLKILVAEKDVLRTVHIIRP
jgi:hypothetical protein